VNWSPPEGSIPTLEVPDLTGVRRVHMIGVGGAGMSGIARILLSRGYEVTGSDLKESRGLEELRRAGATVFAGHEGQQLGEPDVVVISGAIPERNPELAAARAGGVPVMARIQMLAALSRGSRVYGVSGTHGKTTTTSMLAVTLEHAGCDPTYVIGGDLNEIGSGARSGAGDTFVAEADESDGSFLLLAPQVAVVTNIEEDHLDFYRGGAQEIRAAFADYVAAAEVSIACGDDPGVRAALELAGVSAITYGLGAGNDAVLAPTESPSGGSAGRLTLDGAEIELRLKVPGVHNLLNACAALLAAREAGVDPEAAAAGLASFSGVRRRFEYRGTAAGARFFDDYAHHPTEIEATIRAARDDAPTRLVAVFQPHRYTRTQALWRSFGEALSGADVALVTDVYAAGEEPIPGVTGKLIVDALASEAPSRRLVYLPRRADLAHFLAAEVRPGDLVLTLGAGDITMVSEETLVHMQEDA
jgi:UDP-N-acetylmuramate--alanine ligase